MINLLKNPMTKVLIEVPDNLHRLVKSVASSKGESLKNFVLRAMAQLIKQETKNAAQISHTISEAEADELLKPYLLTLANNVANKKAKTINSDKFFSQLKK